MVRLKRSLIALGIMLAAICSMQGQALAVTVGQVGSMRIDYGQVDATHCNTVVVNKPASGEALLLKFGDSWSWEKLTLQSDGNLVLRTVFSDGTSYIDWASNTYNQGVHHISFQYDGNIVLYTSTGVAKWASGTVHFCSKMYAFINYDTWYVQMNSTVLKRYP